MPRINNNPLRLAKAPYQINDIVLLVVTHLPDLTSDYHRERFEIVKTCLQTMRQGVKRNHTFYVWDNGSCDTLRDWIYNEFKPDIVTFSHNIGKWSARTAVATSLPLSAMLCYSDDDMLFYDNWLNPQIELLNFFPNVSVVSGYPVRTSMRWGYKNGIEWARKNAKLEMGHFLSDEWEKDFAESVGRDPDQHLIDTEKDLDMLIEFNEKKAYLTAHHCQFIGYVGKIYPAMIFNNMAMGSEIEFDNVMDKIGLRLATVQRQCRHMGNHIDDKLALEINSLWQKV